jgi:Uma2 family endonuclease
MAVQLKQRTTLAEFEAFVERPENLDKRFEFIDGEIVDVPSNPYVSKIAGWILTALNLFLREHDLGHVTGADGGYVVNGEIYAPDVAYISYERQPELAQKGYNPTPPELAVEVISDPHNSAEQSNLRRKLAHYRRADVLVWVVDYEARRVEVHTPDNLVQLYDESMTLTGGSILPGFELPVKDVFPPTKDA